MEYLATFGAFLGSMLVNIPYMEHMGYAWHMERYAGIIVVVLLVVDGQFNMFENVADVLSACSTPSWDGKNNSLPICSKHHAAVDFSGLRY